MTYQTLNSKSKPVSFADDTSIIVTNSNSMDYGNNIIQVFKNINDWFKANLLTQNLAKDILYSL
jgi:hypothetical protein